jgi:glutaredoxin-like YruB-family protein
MAIVFLLVFTPATASAGIYKWVDENGVLHYADTQPDGITEWEDEDGEPASYPTPQIPAQTSANGGGRMSPEEISELIEQMTDEKQEVEENQGSAVELYTTSWCPYCHKARDFFRSRGIPFVEYNVEKDKNAASRMRSLTRSQSVPFVVINGKGIQGYSAAAYVSALKK